MKNGKTIICIVCGKEKYYKPGYKFGKFCSIECHIKYQKDNAFKFNCVICGQEVRTQPSQIKLRHRKTCSKLCQSILSRNRAKERRVGYTKHQIDRLERYSIEADNWRKIVFERDNYTCQCCGDRGGYLEADHIMPWAYFKELRYEIENGQTLCRKCHDKTKMSSKKMKEIYGQPRQTD